MTYEVIEDRVHVGDWRVEAIGDEGECYITIFSGPRSQQRALEYAAAASPSSATAATECEHCERRDGTHESGCQHEEREHANPETLLRTQVLSEAGEGEK